MNKVYKTVLSVTAASIVAGATLTPATVLAWGDSSNGRRSYTLSEIEAGALGETITFNSISNSKIGDEKNFVAAKIGSDSNTVWSANDITVSDGQTVRIRLYVHNNSPLGVNKIAENVRATFSLPTTVATSHTIIGYLDASNATPDRYWDEVTLNSSDEFYIEYVKGSAQYTNAAMGTVSLPDEVITSGATLGYDSLDGRIPGCYDYDGVVTIEVKVHKSVNALLTKQVRIKGTSDWSESVEAKIGDEVEYRIEYKNILADRAENVMIRDVLPTNIEYVQNSTILYNSNYRNGTNLRENTLTTTGINIGDYASNGNAVVVFTGKVVNKTLACGKNQLVNWASSTVNSRVSKDDASVMVTRENCSNPKPTPTPDDPGHDVIPSTGPAEVAGIALGAGAVVTAGGYFIASRKKLME